MRLTPPQKSSYRGRLAPSPTGFLHLGHARTFWTAQERARLHGGTLILRNEDLDTSRCKTEFVKAAYEDLRWFGLEWQEGPDIGGPHAPYNQSERGIIYNKAFEKLLRGGFVYPCTCSRKDIAAAPRAPHAEDDDEPLYPGTCRANPPAVPPGRQHCWRFRVPDGEYVTFTDQHFGGKSYLAGRDFGDFVVWRQDGFPSYQLACVVDDSAMGITEVVRGADLLKSTTRQILLYRALGLAMPEFYHTYLMLDDTGARLAKRHAALSLRELRAQGFLPEQLRALPVGKSGTLNPQRFNASS